MKKAVIISSIILVIGTAAFFYLRRQRKLIEDTGVRIDGITFGGMKQGVLSLNMVVEIHNKSDISALVKSVVVEAYINGVLTGVAQTNKAYQVQARSKVVGDIAVVVDMNKITSSLPEILVISSQQKNLNIDFKVKVKGEKSGIPFSIPYTYAYTFGDLLKSA